MKLRIPSGHVTRVLRVPEAHRVFHDILNRNLKIQKPIPGYSNHQKILRNYYGKLLVVCCSIFLVLIICHYYVSNFAAKRCVISAMAKSYSESSRSSLLTSKWQKNSLYMYSIIYIFHISTYAGMYIWLHMYIYIHTVERDMYIYIILYIIYTYYIYIYYICILDELSMYILITRTVKAKHAANKKNSIGFFQKFAGFHLVNLGSKPWFAVKKFP